MQKLLIRVADFIPVYPWEIDGLSISSGATCKKLILVDRLLCEPGYFDIGNGDGLKDSLTAIILSEFESTLWLIPWLGKAGLINVTRFYTELDEIMRTFTSSCEVIRCSASINMPSQEYIERMTYVVTGK